VAVSNRSALGDCGYSPTVPVATYPGTVTPLRGLGCYAESERDVFFGREREREELARLVTSQGFRAGLLYGEAGVGKSSLLRAGLMPDLHDQGVVALLCNDNTRPLNSFAHALAQATGQSPTDRENATAFLARVIGEGAQMYLFILDDIDLAMHSDERVTTEVAELFTRVASRSAGRARFLFACASERVHRFASLEQRTGSLFPPTSRYELGRMLAADALTVLERTMALTGIPCDDEVAKGLIQDLAIRGPILPAELQISALAVKEQNIATAMHLQTMGGYAEVERRWLGSAAEATGNERSAMRLLGEIATGSHGTIHAASDAASRAGVPLDFATSALAVFQSKGLVRSVPVAGSEELAYELSHEILAPRVRDVAAPAKRAAERAFDLLGSKAARAKRLSLNEYRELRREGIVPATTEERAVIDRTRLLGKIAIGAACALPVVITLIAYVAMSGNYYFDTNKGKDGGETIVVRAGKPSLSWFNWLPSSPSFGSVVADTGLSSRMVSESFWKDSNSHDISGSLDGSEYAKQSAKALRPRLALLIDYAKKGDGATLQALHQSISNADDFAQLLSQLRPIAQGSPEEEELIAKALAAPSPAVKTEALLVAAAAAQRRDGSYASALAAGLASANASQRRLTISVVRTLDARTAEALYQSALSKEPEPAARRELLALISAAGDEGTASAASATTVLLGENISDATRNKARALLERAFQSEPAAAATDASKLIANASADTGDRILAMSLGLDFAPEESYAELATAATTAMKSQDIKVRAAALPLYAHVSPQNAAGDLARMLSEADLPAEMQVALALGWGEVARGDSANRTAAQTALEQLLRSQRRDVRAAAARAYGYIGRNAQANLIKMVKTEFIDVAESAAYGLANGAEVGAPVGNAVLGIRDMWKRKGRLRRIATSVFARMARTNPGPVYALLSGAARSTEDESLQPVAMEGLCNALKAGYTKVGRDLAGAASNPQIDVRRIAINCVVDNPKYSEIAARVAAAMVDDSSGDIRTESARVLSALARAGQSPKLVGPALSKMVRDDNRGVRMVAIRALAQLESGVPDEAIAALPLAFDNGEEAEKLVILDVAAKIGATDIVPLGIADASPVVRIRALDAAIATSTDVKSILNSSLTDPNTSVRRAALERLSEGKHGLPQSTVDTALALAIRDEEPGIADLAMMASTRLGAPDAVATRLAVALANRSEAIRAKAAAASQGLVLQDPAAARALLEPILGDESHDVRVALLAPLANALAATMDAPEIAKLLVASEARANRRLVAAAAFWVLSSNEATREAATSELQTLAAKGPPLGRDLAALVLSLRQRSADGLAFLSLLVP